MKRWKQRAALVITGGMLLTSMPVQTFAEDEDTIILEVEEMPEEVLD